MIIIIIQITIPRQLLPVSDSVFVLKCYFFFLLCFFSFHTWTIHQKNNREVRKLYSICNSYSSKFALIKHCVLFLFVLHKKITNGKLFLKNTSKIAYHTKEKFSILDKFSHGIQYNSVFFIIFFFSFLGNCQFSTANRYE